MKDAEQATTPRECHIVLEVDGPTEADQLRQFVEAVKRLRGMANARVLNLTWDDPETPEKRDRRQAARRLFTVPKRPKQAAPSPTGIKP